MNADFLEDLQRPVLLMILIVLFAVAGIGGLASAAYDQHRGVAAAYSPTRYPTLERANRAQSAEAFRHIMIYKWVVAGGSTLVALFLISVRRKQDELLPLSAGSGDTREDDLLDWTLTRYDRR
ncbi:MAG: hypothetical protein JWO08_3987 [Verrucomicrobiaceae bacterium]|nr:hypothetical protein [Verrucomicrobiaceae bacterium]